MASESIKISIKLTKEQMANYPVSTESLWCDIEGDYYRIKNIPLFIDNLSYDDLISLEKIDEQQFSIKTVIQPSKNSTIWIFIKKKKAGREFLDKANSLGCGLEGGVLDGYFAINIPAKVDIQKIYLLIDEYESLDVLVADYPSMRH